MIIVDIYGGLGNQMFQYAAGFSLAKRLNSELILDLSAFENIPINQTPRNFELDIFNITAQYQRGRLPRKKNSKLRKVFSTLFNCQDNFYNEPHFHYDSKFPFLRDKVWLHGYWQSFRYFESNRLLLQKQFSFLKSPSDKNLKLIQDISFSNSLSIHIRRGDYITNPNSLAHHPVCSIEYYERALKYVLENQDSIKCFVFSDDIPWVKNNLKLPPTSTYITHNTGALAHEDLRLMMSCKHHVIANSSFSWWAAWLSNAECKLVVAPVIWFKDSSIITSDLIPSNWIRL